MAISAHPFIWDPSFCPMTKTQFMQKRGGIKARTHALAEMAHFPTQCTVRTWNALSLQPHASQALMKHFIVKCAISEWAWVLAIIPTIAHAQWKSQNGIYLYIISHRDG